MSGRATAAQPLALLKYLRASTRIAPRANCPDFGSGRKSRRIKVRTNSPNTDRAAATGSTRKRVRRAFVRSAARVCLLPFLGVVVMGGQAAASTTWYVDGIVGNDGNACTAPGFGNACKTIQAAVNKASSGDTIRVAAGIP